MSRLVINYRPADDGRSVYWSVDDREGLSFFDYASGHARNLKAAERRAERARRRLESNQDRRERLWADIEGMKR